MHFLVQMIIQVRLHCLNAFSLFIGELKYLTSSGKCLLYRIMRTVIRVLSEFGLNFHLR